VNCFVSCEALAVWFVMFAIFVIRSQKLKATTIETIDFSSCTHTSVSFTLFFYSLLSLSNWTHNRLQTRKMGYTYIRLCMWLRNFENLHTYIRIRTVLYACVYYSYWLWVLKAYPQLQRITLFFSTLSFVVNFNFFFFSFEDENGKNRFRRKSHELYESIRESQRTLVRTYLTCTSQLRI